MQKSRFRLIVAEEDKVLDGLKPVAGKPSTFTGSPDEFRIAGEKNFGGVTLEPFYKMDGDRSYQVYWDLISPDQWKEKEEEFRSQWEQVKPAELVLVDNLIIGDEKNELEHKFQGEKTSVRSFVNRKWRQFDKDGWCTMEVKVLPNEDHELRLSSWGSNVNRPLVEVHGRRHEARQATSGKTARDLLRSNLSDFGRNGERKRQDNREAPGRIPRILAKRHFQLKNRKETRQGQIRVRPFRKKVSELLTK